TRWSVLLAAVGVCMVAAWGGGPPWQPRRGGAILRPHAGTTFRVTSWNIERGVRFAEIRQHFGREAVDLALLQEADWEARRSGGRRIAEELASALGLEWVFAPEFLELGQRIGGRDAWHGQATLARLPVRAARLLRFRVQSASWRPKPWLPDWSVFQPREGGRLTLITEHTSAGVPLIVYNLHLESRGPEELRLGQIREVLEDARHAPPGAVVVIAGDFNTKTGAASPVIREILAAGFFVAAGGGITTKRGQALDWIFVRGPARASGARIRDDVRWADHYPVEVTVEVLPSEHGSVAGRL
ncbi:MAG: endonuclease/exonuclease/phosphatase family protein, partial [Bryobacteraceae bacterium]